VLVLVVGGWTGRVLFRKRGKNLPFSRAWAVWW
jgi:hypothetical protein